MKTPDEISKHEMVERLLKDLHKDTGKPFTEQDIRDFFIHLGFVKYENPEYVKIVKEISEIKVWLSYLSTLCFEPSLEEVASQRARLRHLESERRKLATRIPIGGMETEPDGES